MRRNSPFTAQGRHARLQRCAWAVATIVIAAHASQQLAHAGEEPASAPPPSAETQAADPAEPSSPPAKLTEKSTLSQWKAASPSQRSQLAVAMARKQLPAEATKLDLATAAMEITGCLTATAKDPRLSAWTLAPTATTCLTAPEHPSKE